MTMRLTLDSTYTVAASGELQNAAAIGHGCHHFSRSAGNGRTENSSGAWRRTYADFAPGPPTRIMRT